MKKFQLQLYERLNGKIVRDSGGVCLVAQAGSPRRQAILDSSGASATNPVALVNGNIEFYTANSVNSVDLFVMAPGGQFIVAKGVQPGADDALYVDASRHQVLVCPFAIQDTAANTETDTGFNFPANAVILPQGLGALVTTAEGSRTINTGLLASETGGDANGFLAGVSLAAAGLAIPTLASAGQTLGALLTVDESGTGGLVPEAHRIDGTAVSLSYTLSASTASAQGYIIQPYMLGAL